MEKKGRIKQFFTIIYGKPSEIKKDLKTTASQFLFNCIGLYFLKNRD